MSTMASVKWSYSSMSLFMQCPKKYYELRVLKSIAEPPSEQMRYGLDVHKAAEEYIRDGTPIPEKYAYLNEPLDVLKKYKGDILCEKKLGVTRDLQPCEFDSPDVWWRGIADLLVINGDTARIVDYKTGKSGYPDTKQLELLALAVFIHYPEVQSVKAGLLFVVHTAFIKERYKRDSVAWRWAKWEEKTDQMEACYDNDVWNPKQNFTCKAWCPVTSCAHNGRR